MVPNHGLALRSLCSLHTSTKCARRTTALTRLVHALQRTGALVKATPMRLNCLERKHPRLQSLRPTTLISPGLVSRFHQVVSLTRAQLQSAFISLELHVLSVMPLASGTQSNQRRLPKPKGGIGLRSHVTARFELDLVKMLVQAQSALTTVLTVHDPGHEIPAPTRPPTLWAVLGIFEILKVPPEFLLTRMISMQFQIMLPQIQRRTGSGQSGSDQHR
mmetsp:Transcript_8145/g.17733  ORF Transcript_8145/g.17733 Transcript_8145/m.17733 type:complete len:218 (+) Transcript_8145:863-1516(+)